jgi:3-hydroxyacyl-CoA dehydrogenase
MAFVLPENIAGRPMAVIGAGTLGRRIALMLAKQGAEVRLVDSNAYARAAGAAYAQLRPGLPEGPRELLKRMIAEGRLGAKSGRGFYDDYTNNGEGAKS